MPGTRLRTCVPPDICAKLPRINLSRSYDAQCNYGKAASVFKAVERERSK